MEKQECSIFWFRRDLRLDDNRGLYHALTSGYPVLPIFIFDRNILDELPEKDARVEFIHQQISHLQTELGKIGKAFEVFYGVPDEVWSTIISTYEVKAVYTNHDYEPYAKERDAHMDALLGELGIPFHTYKDQVIFEKDQVLSNSGTPYTVFSPYGRKWRATLQQSDLKSYDCKSAWGNFMDGKGKLPSLGEMGFQPAGIPFPSPEPDEEIIRKYHEQRNFPAMRGTTRLSLHLRFGTISIRKLARKAMDLNDTYLNELIWREFYMQILWNFPHVVDKPFRPAYEAIPWIDDSEGFEKWCQGQTGFPIVDAGMRELNTTGFMHNRVRMIVASFLVKDLMVNWQLGEAYFAEKLLDFELSSNSGGWQWAASCGTDAAPYFRIFNPTSQLKKFDPKLEYVRKWVPEYGTPAYPKPIVDHAFARKRVLDAFKTALDGRR